MWFLIVVISFLASLYDVTLASTISLLGGTISAVLAVLLVFLIAKSTKNASVMLIFSVIFLTILSQVPAILIITPYFFVFILTIFLVSRRIIDRPPVTLSFAFFFLLSLIAGLIKIIIMMEISLPNFFLIAKSSFMTAILATLIYYVYNKINFFFNPQAAREKVRINI